VLYALFLSGITLIALAGSIEVLFAGWEFLGLSSALLIGYFHERRAPVSNALRVFAVYRLSDAAMLAAAVLMHHWTGAGSLTQVFYGASSMALDAAQTTAIAVLLLIAVVGKSGLLPLSGWLPRAMEGPTSSSAVFYGSLSIHAGCFLLLRAEPLFEHAPVARVLVIAAGLATALHATLSARVQTDVKSALTYAALTQVGVIVVEIGLGFTMLALVHMVGHACYRLLQFLSAPNILHDLHELENALGDDGHPVASGPKRASQGPGVAAPLRRWLYLAALERGFLDALIDRFVVRPFVVIASALDRFDRLLCGPKGRDRG
jgi:NAD(P)H-quinone oxidoreductase subunit 5